MNSDCCINIIVFLCQCYAIHTAGKVRAHVNYPLYVLLRKRRNKLFSVLFEFIIICKHSCKECSWNRMPCTRYCTDDCWLRCGCKLCCCCCKVCCKSCILHTYLDRDCSLLRCIHSCEFTSSVSIMKKYCHEDYNTGLKEFASLWRYYTADNTCKSKYCNTRHNFLKFFECFIFS